MSSLTVSGVPLHRENLPRRAIVVAVCLGAAGVAVALRLRAAMPFPAFLGACQRLRASGLPVTSKDFFCLPTPVSFRVAFDGALLLMAVAVVLPCAILAASGRRWTSLLPLAVAPFLGISSIFETNRWHAAPRPSGVFLGAVNLATLGVPVMAIWFVRPRRLGESRPDLASAVIAFVACALASAGVTVLARWIVVNHWGEVSGVVSVRPLVPSALAMALFGLLLGTDRRWWPWSLAPVAFLLSSAPSAALIRSPEGWIDRSLFGAVLPLAVVGSIWSLWRPATEKLSRVMHLTQAPDDGSVGPQPLTRPRPSRASLAFTAAAAGLLVISLGAFRGDPLPVQVATTLPTYLGERVQAQDVRTKLDLRMAIAAMDAYAAANGTYRGFDARDGEIAEPALAWSDGAGSAPASTVAIEAATAHTARVAALSESGGGFCVERLPNGELRYGGVPGDGVGGSATLGQAIVRCGSTPWSGAAVRRLDASTMCDGLEPEGGYLICRMVQVLIAQTMARTEPA